MTEQTIKDLDFEFVKEYLHDQFKTRRYKKGVLEVEFTYENDELKTFDLTIQEINCKPIKLADLRMLDAILN